MKIYIAGKITGLDREEAESNFMFAETIIEEAGHEPVNPLKLVDQTEGRRYEDYFLDAVAAMLFCSEAIYLLENWRDSKGARTECAIANGLGMPIYFQASTLPTP